MHLFFREKSYFLGTCLSVPTLALEDKKHPSVIIIDDSSIGCPPNGGEMKK